MEEALTPKPSVLHAMLLEPIRLPKSTVYPGSRQRTKKPFAPVHLFRSGRAATRQNHDASWSELTHDVLLSIMMQLGVVDFVAFIGVCKSWRAVALSNKNMYLESRPPMSIWIRPRTFMQDCCYLEDSSDGETTKITLPHSSGRTLLGSTCGYLILYGKKARDFWLVNPVTKHALHFPGLPFSADDAPETFRGILVFSRSMSGWVFVIAPRNSRQIWFASKAGAWNQIAFNHLIADVHAFKGKIYLLTRYNDVFELRLSPNPTVTFLNTKNVPWRNFLGWEMVSMGEKLYVVGWIAVIDACSVLELDTSEMEWVHPKSTTGYAYLVSVLIRGVYIFANQPDRVPQYPLYNYFHDISRTLSFFKMWYFSHACLNVDIIQDS